MYRIKREKLSTKGSSIYKLEVQRIEMKLRKQNKKTISFYLPIVISRVERVGRGEIFFEGAPIFLKIRLSKYFYPHHT